MKLKKITKFSFRNSGKMVLFKIPSAGWGQIVWHSMNISPKYMFYRRKRLNTFVRRCTLDELKLVIKAIK